MLTNNFTAIQNHFLLEEMEQLVANGTVSEEQLQMMKQNHPATKTNNNILVRIGFFLLGVFLISSVVGFLSLFVAISGGAEGFALISLLMAVGCVMATEILFSKNYFAYGLDDASVLGIPLFLAITVGIFSEEEHAVLLVLFLGALYGAVRYVNVPATFFAILFMVSFVGFTVVHDKILPSSVLPFVMFGLGLGLFFLQWKLKSKTPFFIYKNIGLTVEILSLLLLYASMNYYVVRELSEELLEITIAKGADVPFALLFWMLTFLMPLAYLFFGVKYKNRIFIWCGLGLLGLAFATFRYYHAVLSIEYACLLGGSILFVLVYISIQKLKDKSSGLTFKEDVQLQPVAFDLVKTILINANANIAVPTKPESPMPFGGGGFSGGGSGDNY